MHQDSHPLAGKTVKIKSGVYKGRVYVIEDWWDKLTGKSWTRSIGNPAVTQYAVRSGPMNDNLPINDEVVYGKIGILGHIVHDTELGKILKQQKEIMK